MEELRPEDPREIDGYVLQSRLGAGGMGTVYLSFTRGGQPVALKAIRREYAQDPEFRRRFAREVEAARRVQGPYTAPVLDSSTDGPEPWLAVAYVPGPSLADAVAEHGPLPEATVLRLAAGVAEALASVHAAGVVHRDLKPGNVLLGPDGPRVIDFGIARAADHTALTGTGVAPGTPAYMAPEQISGTGAEPAPAQDVFALGLLIHYAATGRHPFGEGAGQVLLYRIASEEPDLAAAPPGLRELIARCLAKDPADRPTPAQIVDACRELAGAEGLHRTGDWWLPRQVTGRIAEQQATLREVTATRLDDGTPLTEFVPRRRRGTRIAAAAVAVAVLAAGGVYLVRSLTGSDGHRTPSADGRTGAAAAPSAAATPTGCGNIPPNNADGKTWKLTRCDVALKITAPTFDAGTRATTRLAPHSTHKTVPFCGRADGTGADTTTVDLNTLTVAAHRKDRAAPPPDPGLVYLDCAEGKDPRKGLGLEGGRSMGSTDAETPSATSCIHDAEYSLLPDPVPVRDIRSGTQLKENSGLCLDLGRTVVHLWIDKAVAEPGNDHLRTYLLRATQWKKRGA